MSFGKFAVGLLASIFGIVFSNAALQIAHAWGWFPDQTLASLFLSSPTLLQIEWVAWSLIALLSLAIWLAADYFVYKRQFTTALWNALAALQIVLFKMLSESRETAMSLAGLFYSTIKKLYGRADAALFAPGFSATGITWSRRRGGNWKAIWSATPYAVQLGFPCKKVGIWIGNRQELDEDNRFWIETRANDLQKDMNEYIKNNTPSIEEVLASVRQIISQEKPAARRARPTS